MKPLKLFITLIFLIIKSQFLFAWGDKGHEIVAQITKAHLRSQVIDSVQFYLGETSFEKAALWMDEIKKDHAYDSLKPKHYINIDKDRTYVKKNEPNIINELELIIDQLTNKKLKSKAEIKTAIMILFHLVGDLHQPLHVGYASDRGGNDIKITFNNKNSNLHRVWDSDIIEHEKINLDGCLEQYSKYSKKEIRKLGLLNIVEWANDSRTFLNVVYNFNGTELDAAYFSKNKTVVQTQLIKASVRLTATLNFIFKNKS
jgi:hypothetical protein